MVIEYSCKYNEYVLPVYVYSKLNANKANVVNTTVECIVETYYRNYDRRSQKDKDITRALFALADEMEDNEGNICMSA